MISLDEVLETNEMIRSMNFDVRTITMGISLLDCVGVDVEDTCKKIYEKITNQRNDFLQKQSTMLVSENQTICIEDLNVKGMVCNHKLAQHIISCSWFKFFTMLEYKATWYGNKIIKVPTMYPSSQTCSCCGYKNPLVKNLAIRKWECPACHTTHDRDTNASINILKKGCQ